VAHEARHETVGAIGSVARLKETAMSLESMRLEESAPEAAHPAERGTTTVHDEVMLGQSAEEEFVDGDPPPRPEPVGAGVHLIADLWGASRLDDLAAAEQALRLSVDAADAKLLYIYMHHFGPNAGVSGVAVLAESHISIHTWPERNYAAVDAFMCGHCDPRRTLPIITRMFQPKRTVVKVYLRGANPRNGPD
jgi:S-adenosylmethionine decarboxylase